MKTVNLLSVQFLNETYLENFSLDFQEKFRKSKELLGREVKQTFTLNNGNVVIKDQLISEVSAEFLSDGLNIIEERRFKVTLIELDYKFVEKSTGAEKTRKNTHYEEDVELEFILDGGYIIGNDNVKFELL